ncbi:polyketide synthase dehydratase domain-containing protein, partial [Micromonospora tarensis]|uniref:polyketide synthase dehydratase domain-containing protein n=1 Tax=Micromonospora tarensis TaxID=2806100 RepID=UPI002814E92C
MVPQPAGDGSVRRHGDRAARRADRGQPAPRAGPRPAHPAPGPERRARRVGPRLDPRGARRLGHCVRAAPPAPRRTAHLPVPATALLVDPASRRRPGRRRPPAPRHDDRPTRRRTPLHRPLSTDDHPWLADHTVLDTVLLPGAALLELALHAAGGDPVAELALEAPVRLPPGVPVQLQVAGGRHRRRTAD